MQPIFETPSQRVSPLEFRALTGIFSGFSLQISFIIYIGGQSGILGNWYYSAPSTAFTTQKTLTNAGGNATVTNINSSLASNYNNIGINRSNTSFSFLNGNP